MKTHQNLLLSAYSLFSVVLWLGCTGNGNAATPPATAPAPGTSVTLSGSTPNLIANFTYHPQQKDGTPLTISWDVNASLDADFEILNCSADGKNCAPYLLLQCAGQNSCSAIDETTEKAHQDYWVNKPTVQNGRKTFTFVDYLYQAISGVEALPGQKSIGPYPNLQIRVSRYIVQ